MLKSRFVDLSPDSFALLDFANCGRHGIIKVPSPQGDCLSFSANTRQLGDVTVVDVRGGFTYTEGEAIHELLLDLFREGRTKVLLNFRDVSYLDSSGIGQLVRSLYTARRNGAELRAVELNPRAAEVLRLTNLHQVFTDFPDERTALESFPP